VLLDPPVPKRSLRPLDDSRHCRRVERIVEAFATRFPAIVYDVLWDSRSANAQAFLWDGVRCVRLYGGLARHNKITVAGIAWVLAHETGHHLGGPPLHPLHPAVSDELVADAWARQHGLVRVFGRRLARRYAGLGQREVACLAHGLFD
jgi:hypothetical protein